MSLPSLPIWAYGLLGAGVLIVLTVLWMMISPHLGTLVAIVVVGGLAFLIYRAWVSGDLERFLSYARENPSTVLPIALGAVALGAYLAYYATQVPVVDVTLLISYKLTGGEGIGGAILGVKMDANTIRYQFSVVKAYYDLPFLVREVTNPEKADGPGPGYYLEVYVPETGERIFLPFRYVNLFTRYLGGGEGSDMFTIQGLKLSPEVTKHVIVVRILESGKPIWTEKFIVLDTSAVPVTTTYQTEWHGFMTYS